MGRRRKFGRSVNGVLILNKPLGLSSNDALQKAKRLFFARKAGHTGSLDPLATGVLPICFGEATKFSKWLLDADKCYTARIQLGTSTTTGDLEGDAVAVKDTSAITLDQIESVLEDFRGQTTQIPSMYSALKHKGKPLYEYARKGIVVEREPRHIRLDHLMVSNFTGGPDASFDLDVTCSKGTYIRTLGEDIGNALGVGAHLSALHRPAAGPFHENQSFSLDRLTELRGQESAESLDEYLLPVEDLLGDFQSVELDQSSVEFFILGQAVMVPGVYRFAKETDIVRTFSETGEFLGVGEVSDDGRVRPKRLIVSEEN